MNNKNKQLHLNIKGIMASMYYKMLAKKRANQLGLKTHKVKNNGFGSVEIIVEGENETLWEMISWAKRGPYLASVREVVVEFKPVPAKVSA